MSPACYRLTEDELPQQVLDLGCVSPLQAQTQLLTDSRADLGFLKGPVGAGEGWSAQCLEPPTHQSMGSRLQGPSSGDPAASALVGVTLILLWLMGPP